MKKREFTIENEYHYNRKSSFRWVFSHLMRYPWIPVILLAAAALNNFSYGNIQFFIGKGFDVISQAVWKLGDLSFVISAVIISAVLAGGAGLIRNVVFEFLSQRIEKNAREELYVNLLGKSQTFHGKQRIGDIMARATNDVRNVNLMFNPGVLLILDSTLAFIIPTCFIATIHPALLLMPGIFLVILIFTVKDYNRKLKPVSLNQNDQFGKMNNRLAEAIEGIEVVKSNVQENYEWTKFTGDAKIFRDFFVKQGEIQAKYWPMLGFALCWGLALLHALWCWKSELITMGQLVSFMALFNTYRFTTFISIFSFNLVQMGMTSAGRILDLINYETEVDENSEGVSGEIKGKVTFRNVSFAFDHKMILKKLNFTVSPGQTVALVGQTGSGKTTLTRLINRIFDPASGAVSIDDIDIREWNLESLRSQISVIEQDIFLFSRSLRDNIAFGKEEASEDEVINAAKEAQAHNFIMKFKDKYNTEVGERGVTLSGGQKQRIAIGRAFLTDPKILILDDSTSAIDSATEDEIQRAMKKISHKRTTFIITHRLSQIRWADKILVIRKGEVADQGNHSELMERCPDYRRIFAEKE